MAEDHLNFRTAMDFQYGVPSPISPGIVRVVAENPGPFTYKGTNTYLVGSTSLAVIDPGPDDERHRTAILAAAGGRPITHILITHAHRDHIDGAPALAAATGAEICLYPRRDPPDDLMQTSPSGTDFVNYDVAPDRPLADGDTIRGGDWEITAVHTPGHAPDHLSFALEGRGVLFSGDHVMAWNTSVVAPPEGSMADYMAALESLTRRKDTLYLPGHGGRLEEPQRTVKAYLIHRRWREQSILEAIRSGNDTIIDIVPVVYPDIGPKLNVAATLSVQAHVEHLIARGLLACDGPPSWHQRLCPA